MGLVHNGENEQDPQLALAHPRGRAQAPQRLGACTLAGAPAPSQTGALGPSPTRAAYPRTHAPALACPQAKPEQPREDARAPRRRCPPNSGNAGTRERQRERQRTQAAGTGSSRQGRSTAQHSTEQEHTHQQQHEHRQTHTQARMDRWMSDGMSGSVDALGSVWMYGFMCVGVCVCVWVGVHPLSMNFRGSF